jgi:4-diphosphocytidyl-2-C-methyl-D-erythritol kinase
MSRLTALAPAKVNLCLFLGGVRRDGRHELVTVFESLSLTDSLELSVLSEGPDRVICPGVVGPNLVSDALAGLRAAGWAGPPVAISIDKRTPVAAGMGGGSADAAAALRLAGALEPVPDGVLERLAASLGADVAAQLAPGVSLGTGAGEIVDPVAPLAPHAWLILPAAVELSTAAVYREADRMGLGRSPDELGRLRRELEAALRPGLRLPAELLVNDLQPAARSLCPPIEPALDEARQAGADRSIVCGSGPTVAGLFWGEDAHARAAAGVTTLSGRYPAACAVSPVGESAGLPQFA